MPRFARALGLDYAFLGTCSGTPGKVTLSYRLYSTKSKKLVGDPLVVRGSEQQILIGLPALAARMDKLAGAKAAQIPPPIGLTPEDVAVIGASKAHEMQISPMPPSDRRIVDLADKSVLAGVACLQDNIVSMDDSAQYKIATSLLRLAPTNSIVLYTLAKAPIQPPGLQQTLESFLSVYPKCYTGTTTHYILLQQSADQSHWQNQTLPPSIQGGIRESAVQMVKYAPRNPTAHLDFAQELSNEASAVRLGRSAEQIDDRELAGLDRLLGPAYGECLTGTSMDPTNALAWGQLETVAMFSDRFDMAEKAERTALRLDPQYLLPYHWTLQRNLPKWLGDEKSTYSAVNRVIHSPLTPLQKIELLPDMFEGSAKMQSVQMEVSIRDGALHRIAKYPLDEYALTTLYSLAKAEGNSSEERAPLENLIKLFPNSAQLHLGLATILTDPLAAANEYKMAGDLSYSRAPLLFDIGRLILFSNLADKNVLAAAYLSQSLAINPYFYWAMVYFGNDQARSSNTDEAIRTLSAALQIDPHIAGAYEQLGKIYQGLNKPMDMMDLADKARTNFVSSQDVYLNGGMAAGWKKDYAKEVEYFSEATDVPGPPLKAWAQYAYANALYETGRIVEARKMLKDFLADDSDKGWEAESFKVSARYDLLHWRLK